MNSNRNRQNQTSKILSMEYYDDESKTVPLNLRGKIKSENADDKVRT